MTIHERLARLERRNYLLSAWAFGTTGLLACAVLMGAAQKQDDDLFVDSLLVRNKLVVGQPGQSLVVIQSTKDAAALTIQDKQERDRATLHSGSSGVNLVLTGKRGKANAYMMIADQRIGALNENEVRVGVESADGDGEVRLFAAKSGDARGNGMFVFDADGQRRVWLGTNGTNVVDDAR